MITVVKKILSRYSSTVTGSNTVWLFLDQSFRLITLLFVDILVARSLGAKEFGLLSYTLALVTIVKPISTAGLEGILVQHFASASSFIEREGILNRALALRLGGGILSISIVLILSFGLNSSSPATIKLALILSLVSLFQSSGAVEMLLQSQLEGKQLFGSRLVALIPSSTIKFFLAYQRASIYEFAWSNVLESFLQAFSLIIICVKKGFRIHLKEIISEKTKDLFQDSFPFIIAGLSVTLYLKVDSVMLGALSSEQEVGLYAAAARISEGLYFISTVLMSSFSPLIYKYKITNESLYRNKVHQYLGIQSAISMSILVIMLSSARHFIPLLYGANYEGSVSIFFIHILSLPFVFLGIAASPLFIAEGLSSYVARRSMIGAGINILFNLWLIPIFGGIGAAAATLVSYAFASFLINSFLQKTRFIFLLQLRSFIWIFTRRKND